LGRRFPIARWILFEKYGEQPPKVLAQHTCGNKWCVNPDHIVKGTAVSLARARNPKKLSDSDVGVIRHLLEEEDVTQTAIANIFGVTVAQISNIKHGRSRATVR
jgi:hypothetical protein